MRIVGLGATNVPLPTDSNLRPYLPTQPDDRQLSFDAETWQKTGEVMSLLLDNTLLPRQVTICGRRLSIIQGGMRTSTTDESTYFPVTVNATGLTMPNEGCYSMTPVAYLRIKGITTMPRTQLTTAVVTARY